MTRSGGCGTLIMYSKPTTTNWNCPLGCPDTCMRTRTWKKACVTFDIIIRNGVPHQAALNVMADLYDGRHMWGFTEKDIKNM